MGEGRVVGETWGCVMAKGTCMSVIDWGSATRYQGLICIEGHTRGGFANARVQL